MVSCRIPDEAVQCTLPYISIAIVGGYIYTGCSASLGEQMAELGRGSCAVRGGLSGADGMLIGLR